MPALRTIAKPPFGDSVSVSIPKEYRTCSLEIIVLPVSDDFFTSGPFSSRSDRPKPAKRELGGFEEGFYMAQDFDAPLEEFAEYM